MASKSLAFSATFSSVGTLERKTFQKQRKDRTLSSTLTSTSETLSSRMSSTCDRTSVFAQTRDIFHASGRTDLSATTTLSSNSLKSSRSLNSRGSSSEKTQGRKSRQTSFSEVSETETEESVCFFETLPGALQRLAESCAGRHDVEQLRQLTPKQLEVMRYVSEMAERESAEAKERLRLTWRGFGVGPKDISSIEHYLLCKVPLTVRVQVKNLFPHLLNDKYYRSVFEIPGKGESYLEARREWERVLFNGIYDHPSVLPEHRPKYGVLNMVCNPFSDTRVAAFGSAYLLLKDHMRTRVTVATSKENLGSNTRKVGTMNNLLHVVETLSFHEISRLHAVATGRRNHATVTGDSRYSELLIHGMLDLTRDVAAIVVTSQDYRKGSVTRNLIKEVSRKYLVPVLTCEELDEFLEDNRWSTVIQQRANVLVQRTMAMGNTYGSSSYL